MQPVKPCVQEALEEVEKIRGEIVQWWSHEGVARSLMAKFPEKVTTVNCHWEHFGGNWKGIFIHAHGIKNMKDVAPMLRFLGQHGYMHKGNPDVYEEMKRVTWSFDGIKLMCFYDSQAEDACKFVKVGTKVVDEMKLMCPDGAMP